MSIDETDLSHAIVVREALRDACSSNHDRRPMDQRVSELLNEVANGADYRLEFTVDGDRLTPTVGGFKGALGQLVADVFAARSDGTWTRLKACANHTCR